MTDQYWASRTRMFADAMFPDKRHADAFFKMMWQESGAFDADVIAGRRLSSAGAIGLGQLMPQTAASLGVDPYDPEQNLAGAALYFGQMLSYFNGDLTKAVAAYNAGPGNIERGIWPEETQHYVQIVLGGNSQPAALSTGSAPGSSLSGGSGVGGASMTANEALRQRVQQELLQLITMPPATEFTEASQRRQRIDSLTSLLSVLSRENGGDTLNPGQIYQLGAQMGISQAELNTRIALANQDAAVQMALGGQTLGLGYANLNQNAANAYGQLGLGYLGQSADAASTLGQLGLGYDTLNQNQWSQYQTALEAERQNTMAAAAGIVSEMVKAGAIREQGAEAALAALVNNYNLNPTENPYLMGYEPGGVFAQLNEVAGGQYDPNLYRMRAFPIDLETIAGALGQGVDVSSAWQQAASLIGSREVTPPPTPGGIPGPVQSALTSAMGAQVPGAVQATMTNTMNATPPSAPGYPGVPPVQVTPNMSGLPNPMGPGMLPARTVGPQVAGAPPFPQTVPAGAPLPMPIAPNSPNPQDVTGITGSTPRPYAPVTPENPFGLNTQLSPPMQRPPRLVFDRNGKPIWR